LGACFLAPSWRISSKWGIRGFIGFTQKRGISKVCAFKVGYMDRVKAPLL